MTTIDQSSHESVIRRRLMASSEILYMESVAQYHLSQAAYAAQLRKMMQIVRECHEAMTDDTRAAIRYVEAKMIESHMQTFGVMPSWVVLHEGETRDL